MSYKYDAIIVLGGGRTNNGTLTNLSTQRLVKGAELYKEDLASKVFALGGVYSTYNPNAIKFDRSGAELRRDFLIEQGVKPDDIIEVAEGRDTIFEAFVSREKARELGLKKLLVVTSDKHLDRALLIYKRIFGKDFVIEGNGVHCGDLLNEGEESEYLELVKKFFLHLPEDIPIPESWGQWYEDNIELYEGYREIHKRYLTDGVETNQAYMGVREREK